MLASVRKFLNGILDKWLPFVLLSTSIQRLFLQSRSPFHSAHSLRVFDWAT